MKVGIIGLGRMGAAIAYRALHAGHEIIGFDYNDQAQEQAEKMGVVLAQSVAQVAQQTRMIWLMVPVEHVDTVLKELNPYLNEGDIIIDGGNSYYEDSMRRAEDLLQQKIAYLDCGTSGGIVGKDRGFCLMVGGDKKAYTKMKPFFQAIAAPDGFGLVGKSGTGHYVKMVHNGIEYGLLQAYAEGFNVIKNGTFKKKLLILKK
jgi:Predicted 6-phosphogluconate dehydrogenase